MALVGIGGIPIYSTLTDAYLSDQVNINSEYSQERMAGDICYNFIDHSGQLADCSWNKRVLAIDLERLKKFLDELQSLAAKKKLMESGQLSKAT